MKYDDDAALFFHSGLERCFSVLPLYSSFNEMFSGFKIPMLVEVWLIPYEGKIVYDGLLNKKFSLLSLGIGGALNKKCEEARARHGVISSLKDVSE